MFTVASSDCSEQEPLEAQAPPPRRMSRRWPSFTTPEETILYSPPGVLDLSNNVS